MTSIVYRSLLLIAIAIGVYVYVTFPPLDSVKTGSVVNLTALRDPGVLEPMWVEKERISPSLGRAVVAAADPLFFSDRSISVERIRKMLRKSSAGSVGFGTSPITRAVARDVYRTSAANPLNRFREYATAFGMEQRLEKDRILEIYLNTVRFGDVYGAASASKRYFHKQPDDLNAKQSALLAASIGVKGADPEKPDATLTARQEQILASIKGSSEPEQKPQAKSERKTTRSKKSSSPKESAPAEEKQPESQPEKQPAAEVPSPEPTPPPAEPGTADSSL